MEVYKLATKCKKIPILIQINEKKIIEHTISYNRTIHRSEMTGNKVCLISVFY